MGMAGRDHLRNPLILYLTRMPDPSSPGRGNTLQRRFLRKRHGRIFTPCRPVHQPRHRERVSGNWTINNETFEQLPSPEYTFIVPGLYNISLTVTDDTNSTLTETKVDYILVRAALTYMKISFSSEGLGGADPVIITDKSSGDIVFVGNTSSKDVRVNSTGRYSVQTFPGGWTGILTSPDYGLALAADWAKKNMIGILIGGVIVLIIIGLFIKR